MIVNTIASVLLLKYPPPPATESTAAGAPIIAGWSGLPSKEGKRQRALRQSGFKLATSMLALGFFLQLLDLLAG